MTNKVDQFTSRERFESSWFKVVAPAPRQAVEQANAA
jgi:hypothetical protein